MNNKKTRLQRFISSSIAVLLFAAIALGAALPAAASAAGYFGTPIIGSRELCGGLCQNPNRQSSR